MNKYKWITENGKHRNEHRKIMEDYLGRKLDYNEVVHHIDENKSNNNIENLRLMTRAEHTKVHTKKKSYVTLICYGCGKKYSYLESLYRYRLKQGQNKFMCSKKCVGLNSKKFLPHPKSKYCLTFVKKGLNEGLNACEIERKYNVNRGTVYRIKNKYKL